MDMNFAVVEAERANSPEEAALAFKAAVTQGLAAVIADALGKSLKTKTGRTEVKGWQAYVGGMHLDLAWAKPPLTDRSLTQLTCFCPADLPEFSIASRTMAGFEVGIGISIKGSF